MVSPVLRSFCAAALFAAPALPAFADTLTNPSPSPSPVPEIVHVVTADRSDETLHSTTRTTYVVTRDQIARNGYRTIGDALATLPGVEITRYGPIGQNVSYGIRGSSSAQVLVLIDGEPAPGELANSVQLGTMSTAAVRRIEVVEGGGSTLYGTGAIGGIINIITEAQYPPTSATLRYGTFDDREFKLESHGFSFERIVANNAYALPPSADAFSGTPNPVTRINSDDATSSFHYGVDRKIGAFDTAFRAGIEEDHLGASGFFPFLSPTSREDDVNAQSSLAFTLNRAQSVATLQLAETRQQILFGCDAVNDVNCFVPLPALSTESQASLSLRNVVTSTSNRLLYGTDLSRGNVREDDGAGSAGSISFASLVETAAYVQETRSFRGGEFYAGVRGERDGTLGGEFSPSLGFRAHVARNLDFRLNAASAFRAPNASELYFPGYGNASLHAERAKVGDLSLTDTHFLGGVTLGWFTNWTNDLIVASITGYDNNGSPIFHPENVDRAAMQGFTLDAQTLPFHGVTLGLKATDLYRAQDVETQSRLPNDPVFSIALELGIQGPANSLFHDAGVTVRAVGARGAVVPTQPLFYQPVAYNTVDAYAQFRVVRGALLTLRGYNLGNERYAEVAGYPMPGRTFAVELSAK